MSAPAWRRMRRALLRFVVFAAAFGGGARAYAAVTAGVCPVPVVDDRAVHIHGQADVDGTRSRLTDFIWDQSTLPAGSDALSVIENVADPFGCAPANLARVDRFSVAMPTTAAGVVNGWAWHFVPVTANNRLMIVHNGHMPCGDFSGPENGPGAFGLQATTNALLAQGFDVLFVLMPLFVPDQCLQQHDLLFQPDHAPNRGSPIRYFLDTTLQSVNYLVSTGTFKDVGMLGLSGGGWTTTLYAAVDTRVTRSFPIAGTIPLYLRGQVAALPAAQSALLGSTPADDGTECNNLGDIEQSFAPLYRIAGYPDLYVLGAVGAGRRQLQILNRRDACCFGEQQEADPASYDSDLRAYEAVVRSALLPFGNASFRLEVDEASITHQISRHALYDLILAQLDLAGTPVGATNPGRVFRRGDNGKAWYDGGDGWVDLGVPIVGTPSVVEDALYAEQFAARDPTGRPILAHRDGNAWRSEPLLTAGSNLSVVLPAGRVVSDPVALSAAPGQLDVVAQGTDLNYYRWRVTASGQTLERAGGGDSGVGIPAFVAADANALQVYFRGGEESEAGGTCREEPNVLYGLVRDLGGWQPAQRLGGETPVFPSAGVDGDTPLVFAIGSDAALWQYQHTGDFVQGAPISSIMFSGSPARPQPAGAGLALYARTQDGDLASLAFHNRWRTTSLGLKGDARPAGSPTSVNGGVYWNGNDGKLRFYDGRTVSVLDRFETILRDDFDGPIGH
jgi:hypothetical protein